MKVMLEAELLDEPGQLVRALKVIARYQGNIHEIIHIGERRAKRDGKIYIPLRLIFTVPGKLDLENINKELIEEGIAVLTSLMREETNELKIILCGKSERIDVKNMLSTIKGDGVEIEDFKYKLSENGESFSAIFRVIVPPNRREAAFDNWESYANSNQLLLIKPVVE
jgi:ACT domain-containing protein